VIEIEHVIEATPPRSQTHQGRLIHQPFLI